MHNAITGIQDHLYHHLVKAINRASSIRIAVAFLMESGVHLLCPHLLEAAKRGVPIKVLTGCYLSVTEPSALYLLLNHLEDTVDIRFYENSIRVFHPKAYIIDYQDDGEIFVGSSNMSQSALKGGVEWNYRLRKQTMAEDYQRFSQVFDALFYHHAVLVTEERLKEYALTWKKPQLFSVPFTETDRPTPRGAQIEALYALKRAREEGIDKGLVVAATGTGKNFLSVFDSLPHEHILYVAHREEILKQAFHTYKQVRRGGSIRVLLRPPKG